MPRKTCTFCTEDQKRIFFSKVVKKLSKGCQKKSCQKVVKKVVNKLSKNCQKLPKKVVKKMSNSCQKLPKNCQKLPKKLSKSCQKSSQKNGKIEKV
jgi:hypothetical protein